MEGRINIGIVVVTYNGASFIRKCLSSLGDLSRFKCLVVDNASEDETIKIVASQFPEAELMCLSSNLGFGKANNIGIGHVLDHGVDQVLLLNQDAYIEHIDLIKLSTILQNNLEFGVVSPIHLSRDGQLDYYFSGYLNNKELPDLLLNLLKGVPIADVYRIGFVNAALWLIDRETLEIVGGFDPLFHHYGEDRDWINRLRFHEMHIGVAPAVFGYHDRIRRIPSKKLNKKVVASFNESLISLLNINQHFNISILQLIIQMLRYTIGSLIRFKLEFVVYPVVLFKSIVKLPTIHRHRELSKSSGLKYLPFKENPNV